ncbi:XRE family transcriptional regulator [Nonomuraea typhae]|uniref:XRE family transcriptional regulator n=1 Tax=Nonomuraea typhae TaxID=2603600 RepID=UPI0012F95BB3|nr:XRE family transcriptional regulator [Nonomuraea typhae]
MANERLRAALLAKGVGVADLAQAIEVDPKTIERWITKDREPYRKHRYAAASYLGVDESYLWPKALTRDQVASASESEIITLYPHRWAVPRDAWGHLFEKASQEIGILVYSGLFIADDRGLLRLLADKARAGVRVRVLLGEPDSAEVAQRGVDEGIGDGMGDRCRNAIAWFRPLASDGVEIRLHHTVLYNSIFRGDDQLLVNTHAYGQPAGDAPVLHLRRVAGGDMVGLYLGSFEKTWNGAVPLES